MMVRVAPLSLVLLAGCAADAPLAREAVAPPTGTADVGPTEQIPIDANNSHAEVEVSAGAAYTVYFTKLHGALSFASKKLEGTRIDMVIETASAGASWDVVSDIAKNEFLIPESFP
jgi:hypothetical protein